MIRSALPPFTNLSMALTSLAFSIAIPCLGQELPIAVADLKRSEPVDFATEIMPLLKRNCLACHHQKEAEGGLVLETSESIHKGGDGGSSVNLEDPINSLLLTRTTGTEEPLMPPEDNSVGAKPLTPDELGLLRLWIQQGAKGSAVMQESIQWQEIPESIRTSLALSVAPDGQLAVVGRGNRALVVDLVNYQPTGHLVDPDVAGGNAAHVDLVQSIAVSPDANRIATGGFRTVKLWKKTPLPVATLTAPLTQSSGMIAVKADESAAAIVNAIGDIEIWDLAKSQRTQTLTGHADAVSGLAWAGTTDRLVSCDSSGRIFLWNASTGEPICDLDTSAALVKLSVSEDGQQLAAIDVTGQLHRKRINAEAKALESIDQLPEGVTQATDVVFAAKPNPALIVSDQATGVIVMSLADNKILRKIDHGAVVDAVALSADQSQLITGGRDGKTRVWNLSSGEAVFTLEGDPQVNLQLVYSKRETQRQKSTVERLTKETAELEKRLTTENEVLTKANEEQQKASKSLEENEKKRVDAAAATAATEKLISTANEQNASAEQTVKAAMEKLAATNTKMETINKDLQSKTTELNQAKEEAEKVKAQVEQMKKLLADADAKVQQAQQGVDQQTTVLAKTKEEMVTVQAEIDAAKKTAAESKAAAEKASKDLEAQKKTLTSAEEAKKQSELELAKRQQALDTATQAQKRAEQAIPAHQAVIESQSRQQALLEQRLSETEKLLNAADEQVLAIAVSRNSNLVATSHQDGSVRVYRLDNGKPVSRFESGSAGFSNRSDLVAWVGDDVICFGRSASPRAWSTKSDWKLERTIGSVDDPSVISDRVTAIVFRQDGMTIAVGSGLPSRSGEVKVFAVQTGRLVRDFGEIHSDSVLGLSFSPRGRFIASSGADKTVRLLEIATGQVTRSLEGHTHHVLSIAWQDDGQSIASASADRTVKVWDAETGEQKRTISGFGKEITAIRFVAATNQLATACADGQVRLYDTSNGKSIRTFNASGDFLFSLGVSLDGKTLLASGQSGVLRVWNVDDAKLLNELK